MSVKLQIDSEKIDADGMFTLKTFLGNISLTDLMIISKMIDEEINERIDIVSTKYFK